MTPQFTLCAGFTMMQEGGLVDNPNDPGKLTNLGISASNHPELTRQEIISMRPERAALIYQRAYWNPIKGDNLPLPLALVTFDAALNSGPSMAAQWLQKALRVTVDGNIGPKTILAASTCDKTAVITDEIGNRLDFLQTLPFWKDFGVGWMERCKLVRQTGMLLT